MKMANRTFSVLGIFLFLSACSSGRMAAEKGELFSDPGKFESLASGAFEGPAVPVREIASVSAPAPALEIPVTTPEGAFQALIKGNERFVAGMAERRRELASEHKPFAVVLSCSDSRVPAEFLFDQKGGDLFTVQVAGNVIGSAQVASIEYAVQTLGAKLIVVMGHESCGAVRTAIEAKGTKNTTVGSPDLDWLVGSIRPVLQTRGLASIAVDDPKLRKPVTANIDSVTDSLLVRSKIVGDRVAKGELKIVRGISSLESGKVDFWGAK